MIRVHSVAICGTDMRIYNYGHFKISEGDRRVLSHEVSGEIVELGAKVKGLHAG